MCWINRTKKNSLGVCIGVEIPENFLKKEYYFAVGYNWKQCNNRCRKCCNERYRGGCCCWKSAKVIGTFDKSAEKSINNI